MKCPYCDNTRRFSDPVPVCAHVPPELEMFVPFIQQCLECQATLSPNAFRPGDPAYVRVYQNKWGQKR